MPKLKTKSGAKKRFKLTAKGKIKRHKGGHSHLQVNKSPSRKRRLRKPTLVSGADEKRIKRILHSD